MIRLAKSIFVLYMSKYGAIFGVIQVWNILLTLKSANINLIYEISDLFSVST